MTAYNQYLQMKAITESCQDRFLGNAIMEGYTAIYESALTESIKDKLLGLFKKSATSDDTSEKKECAAEGKEILRNVNGANLGKKSKALLTTLAMGILLSAGAANAATNVQPDVGGDQPQMELSDDDPAIHNNKLSTGYGGHNPRSAVASTEQDGVKYILYSNNDISSTYSDSSTVTVHPSGTVDICLADGAGHVGGKYDRYGNYYGGKDVKSGCQNFDDYNGLGDRTADVSLSIDNKSHQDYMNTQQARASNYAKSSSKGHLHSSDKAWYALNHSKSLKDAKDGLKGLHELTDEMNGIGNHVYKVDDKKVSYDQYLKAAQENQELTAAYKKAKATYASHPHANPGK